VSDDSRKIAVIGMAARFAGARNTEEFWDNLRQGRESISFFSEAELIDAGHDPAIVRSPRFVKAAGAIEQAYGFDAAFFGYAPREAELMDPQHRVFLETCWQALEDAGYDPLRYSGNIGLFASASATQYLFHLLAEPALRNSVGALPLITANDKDYLATRVGYKLNCRGPCMAVQTACSSSLAAVVLACQSLLNGQSDIAMAGGVRIDYPEKSGYLYEDGSINSADGHCRTFDADASGTVWGCGSGVVVLKRLDDALAAHDEIHAVILGYGLNNDGSSKTGFTAPSVAGQSAASSAAIAMAGIDVETIGYVECHGTATPVGDPVEIAALTRSFEKYTSKRTFCAVGSVKTNIGHTDAASGVAGFIKAVLSLKRKEIPASLNFKKPNPKINFADSPFYVNDSLSPWRRGAAPRRAGINSFGIGGTNVHVILEEAPTPKPGSASRPLKLLALSARTAAALDTATANLLGHIRKHHDQDLADIAYTLQVGRAVLPHRRFMVCRDRADAIDALGRAVDGGGRSPRHPSNAIAFLFPGQGAQHPDMGKELYETEPTFREEIDECAAVLRQPLGLDLRDLLYPGRDATADADQRLNQTAYAQPALFATEFALARLWMTWGVHPHGMLGHSIGEYVAACLAGVFSRDDALRLVAARGALMQRLPAGAMLGVLASEAEVGSLLGAFADVSIAAINGPAACVVSGLPGAIAAFEQLLAGRNMPFRRLTTSHAFHSAMMDPVLEAFRAVMRTIPLAPPRLRYISNVTGTWATGRQATDADYWVEHLRHPVRFADGLAELTADTSCMLLEVGPGRTLSNLADRDGNRAVFASLPNPGGRQSQLENVLTVLGETWSAGLNVDWDKFYQHEARGRVRLPTYPFERQEYKLKGDGAVPRGDGPSAPSHAKRALADWFYVPSWKRTATARSIPSAAARTWLIFLDRCGIGSSLVDTLRQTGQDAVTVDIGAEFARKSPAAFQIQPGSRDDYTALLREIGAAGRTPTDIVHLWAVNAIERAPAELGPLQRTLECTFYSLVNLTSALANECPGTAIQINVVSNALHDVSGEDVRDPVRATIMGPVRAIPREYPTFSSRCIDIVLPANPNLLQRVVQGLFDECQNKIVDEVVAFRGGHRWAQTFALLQLPERPRGPPLRDGGAYLITGGLGGIGLSLADYLFANCRAKLALVGRSPFPERRVWSTWLATHSAENATSKAIRRLVAMEEAGAEVAVFQGDVADLDRLQEIVRTTRARFGPIRGAIHCAGVGDPGHVLELTTPQSAGRVLEPKLQGTLAFVECLHDEPLDFMVLSSSVAGLFGLAAQAAYIAANSFVDAFAHSRKSDLPAAPVAIDWDRWDDVGMALSTAGTDAASADDMAPPVEELKHPVFTGSYKRGEEVTYIAVLSPRTHWIIGEHLLLGRPTLVGTAYLELARAAFSCSSRATAIEMRDVVFMRPMVVGAAEDREVHVVLSPSADGFEFRIKSRYGNSAWQDHAMGWIGSWQGASLRHDFRALLAQCRPIATASGSATAGQPEFVAFSERWNNLRSIVAIGDEAFAEIALPSRFAGDCDDFVLHPALLDTAAVFPVQLAGRQDAYLPFTYDRVRVSRSLGRAFWCHATIKPDSGSGGELLRFDLTLADERGDELVSIEGCGLKRIRELSNATIQPDAPAISQGFDIAGERILSPEGAEAFGRVLAALPIPQVVVAPKGVDFLAEISRPQFNLERPEAGPSAKPPLIAHPRPNLPTPYVAPRTSLEQTLADVWRAVIGIETVGVDDNFLDLGGHSLLAIQVASRIRESFGINCSIATLYENPTVAQLAEAVVHAVVKDADAESVSHILHELERNEMVAPN
jgi:phthiocerol/phenolphthiocerol synthesis type-I polyketide synthase E